VIELLRECEAPIAAALWEASRESWADTAPGEKVLRELVSAIEALPAESIAALPREAVTTALQRVTDSARYWQEPDETDAVAAHPSVRTALGQHAEAALAHPAASWWSSPLVAGDQHVVAWEKPFPPEGLSGSAARLTAWREAALADELRAPSWPAGARVSGSWWSTPVMAGVPSTTRTLPDGGARAAGVLAAPASAGSPAPVTRPAHPTPAGLVFVEDSLGWTSGFVQAVDVRGDARVYEVNRPDDWAALVARFPFAATASRRGDWTRATGRDGAWSIPDWAAVAGEFDGVHLTVLGYLATAGCAIPVPGTDAASVVAGWQPDTTFWLSDSVVATGPGEEWVRAAPGDIHWAPAG